MFKGEFLDDELWAGDAPRVCRLVFIGVNGTTLRRRVFANP